MSKDKKEKKSWLYRILIGEWAPGASNLFEIWSLSRANEKRAKEREAYFKKHGLM